MGIIPFALELLLDDIRLLEEMELLLEEERILDTLEALLDKLDLTELELSDELETGQFPPTTP